MDKKLIFFVPFSFFFCQSATRNTLSQACLTFVVEKLVFEGSGEHFTV